MSSEPLVGHSNGGQNFEFIDETFSFFSENNYFSFQNYNQNFIVHEQFDFFDDFFHEMHLDSINELLIQDVSLQKKTFMNHIKIKNNCPICMDNDDKDGFLLECCEKKQFICEKCISHIKETNKDDCMRCPFCRENINLKE